MDRKPQSLAVLGAGVMGSGIAAMAVGHGMDVFLVEVDENVLARARDRLPDQLRHAQMLGVLPTGRPPGNLSISTSIRDVGVVDAVIEAVTEESQLKRKVLAETATVVGPGTPLVSNTSSIPIDELAADLPRPEDLVGTHFMNPAYLITMVEVVRGPRTSHETMAAVIALLDALGRRAIVVRDTPGFVTSRLLHSMINDAARIVGEGVAAVEDVDALLEGCLGHSTGPLRTADLIGLDNLADSLIALHERTGEDRYRPAPELIHRIRHGHLGRKAGRGFYDYGEVPS
ncbi:3-hydroxyacyl-CoA dehydrogenase family protein [Micromonospora eburnea]|uniref:Methoxymalonate biosynthesis protein n=1 Tax=Micromonospora eburnea TaxID=227316 RepID=A0A1C6UIT6_9ACTN|nr:3-hydroxyacyl-CoA dehydrogenase family protein [Micromonospora eburnea]SCL53912.1 methoxymalonate biosynthesis protein [Micromonospora eburnea]